MFRKFPFIVILSVLLAAWIPAKGALVENWRINAPTGPVPNDNSSRGLAYNPSTGHVLVARTAPEIVVLDASSGANLGTMNVNGISTGTLKLVKIRVVDFGPAGYAVYGCNLSINSKTEPFIIYRWFGLPGTNEWTLGAPEIIYCNRAVDALAAETFPVGPTLPQAFVPYAQRLGDTFAVRHTGGGSVEFYVGVARANILNSVYKFTYTDMQLPQPTNSAVSAVSEITVTGLPSNYGFGTALRGEYVDPVNGDIWHQTNGALAVYSSSGAFKSMVTGVHPSSLHGVPLSISGKRYYCAIHHGVPRATTNAYARFSITDVTDGAGTGQLVDFGPMLASPNHNGNGTGDFDTDGSKIFALVTNNYVGSWTFTPPSAGTTKKWTGAGTSTSWFDPANWNPAGVPSPLDDVVLDHTFVAGAYTVDIDSGTTEANCRTLTVGDPLSAGNLITLRFTSAATINELLNIAGDLNPATPDVRIREGGRFEFSPAALSGATSIYYFDPTATCIVESGGYLQFATTRSITTPFPGALPSGLIPVSYGAWTFAPNSTVEFNATSAAIPFSGRTFGNLVLNGSVNYTASGSLPVTIKNTLTIGLNATFKPTMSGPMTIEGGVVNNATATSEFNAAPLIIANSMTWPANVSITGDLVVPAGVTLTANNPLTLGGNNTGKIAHIFGTLTCNNTLNILGTIAPRVGGVINGLGSVTWGTYGGFATDNPAGFANMPPIASDFPGFTLAGAFTGVPSQTNGVWGFCGNIANQNVGALIPGDVGGLVCDTVGSVALPGDYRCVNVLSLKKGLLNVNNGAGTITLGTSASNNGSLTYPSGYIALIQGTFKRWRGTAALSSIDFPLADSAGTRRMLTLTSSGGLTAGGTIAVQFIEGDPGGWPFDLNPGGSTSALDNLNKVDPKGVYRLVTGDGMNVSGSGNWTVVADVDGFAVDPLGQKVGLVARDATNPTSWKAFTTPNAPTYKLHQMLQSISNPEHPSFGVLRVSGTAPVADVFYASGSDVGVGEPFPAKVAEWSLY